MQSVFQCEIFASFWRFQWHQIDSVVFAFWLVIWGDAPNNWGNEVWPILFHVMHALLCNEHRLSIFEIYFIVKLKTTAELWSRKSANEQQFGIKSVTCVGNGKYNALIINAIDHHDKTIRFHLDTKNREKKKRWRRMQGQETTNKWILNALEWYCINVFIYLEVIFSCRTSNRASIHTKKYVVAPIPSWILLRVPLYLQIYLRLRRRHWANENEAKRNDRKFEASSYW